MSRPLIKINRNKFEIENGKIAIYINTQVKIIFYVFAILTLPIILVSIYVGYKFNTLSSTIPYIIFNLVIAIILILIGNFFASKKIVFDKVTQEVYSLLGSYKKHILYFNEIHDINKNTNIWSGFYYRIQPKNDLVGNGIRISVPYASTTSKQENEFIKNVLPKLEEMVFVNQPSIRKNTVDGDGINNIATISFVNFKTIDNTIFQYAPIINNLYFLIYSAILTALIYFAASFIPDDFSKGKPAWGAYVGLLLFTGLCLYGLYRNSQKIILDKSAQTITQTNFWGLIKYSYAFQDFEKYLNVKNYKNGIYTGTDLKIIFENKQSIKITNKYNTQKIQQLIDELNVIIFKDSAILDRKF